jgi:hypothetical protein
MSDSRASYLTVAQAFNLNHACRALTAAGYDTYQVGSSLDRPDYRDVDLRALLQNAEFDAMFEGNKERLHLLNVAISEWLAARTGLPIDFQFQRQADANVEFKGMPRNYMGVPLVWPPERGEL